VRQEFIDPEIQKLYRSLFSGKAGRQVLEHMLLELGYFDEIETEEQRVLYNYGRRLLVFIGALEAPNLTGIVDYLARKTQLILPKGESHD